MKTLSVVILFALLFSSTAKAQAPQLYLELGGPGGLASINFDSRFSKKETGIGGRIGASGFIIKKVGLLFVPAAVNYLFGKEGTNNFFELGAGITYIGGQIGEGSHNRFNGSFGHLNFGYRYQSVGKGVTFRAAINPLVFLKIGIV